MIFRLILIIVAIFVAVIFTLSVLGQPVVQTPVKPIAMSPKAASQVSGKAMKVPAATPQILIVPPPTSSKLTLAWTVATNNPAPAFVLVQQTTNLTWPVQWTDLASMSDAPGDYLLTFTNLLPAAFYRVMLINSTNAALAVTNFVVTNSVNLEENQ